MTDVAALVTRLERYGVPEAEGRLYFHLCRMGGARAADVAREAAVVRTDAYRLLDSLVERGCVEKTLERPARFVPVPVHELLERAVRRKRTVLAELDEERAALERLWPHNDGDGARDRRIAIHQGRNQVQGLLERLIASARETLSLAVTMHGIGHLDREALLERLRERHEAGVRVELLTRVEPGDLDLLRRAARVATVRHADLGEYHEMLLVDSDQAALFVGGTHARDAEGGKETLLSITSPPFVMAQKALLDAAWDRAVAFEDRVAELRDGTPAPRMEILRGRWMRTDRLKQMLYRHDRLDVLAPAAEVRRWAATGVLHAIRRRAAQGCAVRILTDGDVDVDLPVHRVPAAARLIATDGETEVLVVEDCSDDGGPTREDEWSLWSSLPNTVASLRLQLRHALDAAVVHA